MQVSTLESPLQATYLQGIGLPNSVKKIHNLTPLQWHPHIYLFLVFTKNRVRKLNTMLENNKHTTHPQLKLKVILNLKWHVCHLM